MTKQTREEFLNEVRKTGTTVEQYTRTINGVEHTFPSYKEPAVGRCKTCNDVKMWQKRPGLKLADVRCAVCGGELKRTTYTAKVPYKANLAESYDNKAEAFAKKVLEE